MKVLQVQRGPDLSVSAPHLRAANPQGPQGQRELAGVVTQHWEALNTQPPPVCDTPDQAQLSRGWLQASRSQRPGPLGLSGPLTSLPAWSFQ